MMFFAASEHRKTHSSASCSGVVNCSDGCFLDQQPALGLFVVDAIGDGARVDLLLHQRRQHPARADGIAR